MSIMKKILSLLLVVTVCFGGVRAYTRAIDPYDDLQKQINELSQAREQSVAATKPLEAELSRLQEKIDNIEAGIAKAKADLRALEISIVKREREFSEQYVLLAE